jgi:hypothetical protein
MEVFFLKTIAIQRGLEEIKMRLDAIGYNTLYHDEISTPIDAYVYYGTPDQMSLVSVNNMLNNSIMSSNPIVVNAYQKSIDDIVKIIESRVYSPLF